MLLGCCTMTNCAPSFDFLTATAPRKDHRRSLTPSREFQSQPSGEFAMHLAQRWELLWAINQELFEANCQRGSDMRARLGSGEIPSGAIPNSTNR